MERANVWSSYNQDQIAELEATMHCINIAWTKVRQSVNV